MKKNNINKKSKDSIEQSRAAADRRANQLVTLTSVTILYALLLLFLQRMSRSTETIQGAQAFIQILFWGSIVGAMVCAAWGAYKENKNLFTYCGVFVYILWSMTVVQYCGNMGSGKAYTLVYLSLLVIFILTQVYGALIGKGQISRRAMTAFIVVTIVLFVLFCIAAIVLHSNAFGLLN